MGTDLVQKVIGNQIASSPVSAQNIVGTTTNDNAPAGSVGEYISSVVLSGSALSIASVTAMNVTSITLTAGDWDVTGVVDYLTSGSFTFISSGSSSVSASFGDQDSSVAFYDLSASTKGFNQPIPVFRYLLAATTVIYLVAETAFYGGTTSVYGTIRARRVR